jgi:hypothetical protein
MFKRMLLGVTMLAAMGVGGLGINSTAAAHGCDYGYGDYGYRAAYYPTVVPYYTPRVVYYPSSYATFRPIYADSHHHHYDHHHHSGVTLSVGF